MNLDQFVEAVKTQTQPEARARHLEGILQELLTIIPGDVTLADLAAGWQVLARPKSQNEEAAVTHRRHIAAYLAAIAAQFTSEPGNLAGAVKTWQEWQNATRRSNGPHQALMAKTLTRELMELQFSL